MDEKKFSLDVRIVDRNGEPAVDRAIENRTPIF
jgi:hypothetical protein